MENNPVKCRRPSKCQACGLDMRRGQLIKFMPLNAKPGRITHWVHEGCAE